MLSRVIADDKQCLLAFKMIKGIGNISALKLISRFHSAQAVFQASAEQLFSAKLNKTLVNQIQNFDFSRLTPLLDWEKQLNCTIIVFGSAYYPPLLAQIHNPPLVLFTHGNPETLISPQIAVVGSRNPTAQGISNTQSLCQAMSQKGFTITSGLAMGVDGEAHRAALNANGYTIAVMGTGLNRVYPAKHRQLAHQIANQGLLISEKLPDEPLDKGSFPQRNRIIAGLSLGTLVVEAAYKSGSLITAQHALEAGREIYAIPGSIHNPLARGCHKLIKQGAKLVETIEDIIEDLPSLAKAQIDKSNDTKQPVLTSEEAQFLNYIDYDTTPIDTIISRSQLTAEIVINKLLLLELSGQIINCAGGYIRQ